MHCSEDGDKVCKECFALGSKQKFLTKVSSFVHQLDEAKLLYYQTFREEHVEDFIAELRSCCNYVRRAKHQYEESFGKPPEKLHHHIRCVWSGRVGQCMTECLALFHAQFVKPCLDTEPGQGMKEACLEELIRYMTLDPNTDQQSLNIVRAVVTGRVSRHPAVQGVMTCCMAKLRQLDNEISTMKNPHRSLPVQFYGLLMVQKDYH